MLKEEVKRRMIQAMKAGNVVEKEILRVLRGELDVVESRGSGPISDEDAERVVRKLVKSNEETLGHSQSEEQRATLRQENEILASLLPKLPTAEELCAVLAEIVGEIRGAGNDGQATGVAMKHLKGRGITADGKTVAQAVKTLRS